MAMELDYTAILDLSFPHNIPINKSINERENKWIQLSLTYFYYSVRQFVKLEYPKYCIKDIPLTYRKCTKLDSILLQTIYNLCINTLGRPDIVTDPNYKKGGYWFVLILKEFINARVTECTEELIPPRVFYPGQEKRGLIEHFSKELTMINDFENPYKDDVRFEHFAKLIDCAVEMSAASEYFKKTYLKPYIKAGRDIIKDMRSPNWQRMWIDSDGDLVINRTGSRSKLVLVKKTRS
jgi:hypothetical protein